VVATSEDPGVSGDVSPFKRRGLGKWLTDPSHIAQYDEIVASSVDRVGRSARDLHALQAWAEDNGKRLRILSPSLVWPADPNDLSGPIVWDVLGRIAEVELKLIKKRYADMRQMIKDNGALLGKPPFGFIIVGEKYAKTLAPDPSLVSYLRGMIDRALRGDTLLSICRWLDAEGVAPAKGEKWSPTSASNVLRNPVLKGRRVDAQGKVLLKFESLLSAAQFAELQSTLNRHSVRHGKSTSETALLTGVIECDLCGGPMYRINSATKRKDGTKNICTYYRCKGKDYEPSRCRNSVPLSDIESWLDQWFTYFNDDEHGAPFGGPFADTEIVETTVVAGDDHAAEVAEVETEIRQLDLDADDFQERQQALLAERARLKALPSEVAQIVERPTGMTVGDVWVRLDDSAKRHYLRAAGVKVRVRSSAQLRSRPGAEVRYVLGDPHKIIGTLKGVIAEAAGAERSGAPVR
jgi:hypothetical protein